MGQPASLHPGIPVLYSFRRCPYAMRARLAIRAAGLTVQLREVVLREKPGHMIVLSPKATVPVLWLTDSIVIDESLDIMHWAAEQAPAGVLLKHSGDDALIALFDTRFKFHLDRYKYANRYDGAHAQTHRDSGLELLQQIDDRLAADKNPWLGGSKPQFADLAILPFVRQFRIADPQWFDECAEIAHVKAWLNGFLASVQFQSVMQKYPQWREGEDGIAFGCEAAQQDSSHGE